MRWIPPGSFMMGSPENEVGRFIDEFQHRVELTQGVWLGNTPVTQALWEAVMGTNPSLFKDPMCPVETVTWEDCQTFYRQLNQCVVGLEARLPTEAEWEYSCRAGTTTSTWIGDLVQAEDTQRLESIGWFGANSGGRTNPVAQKPANPWGLYDMFGNVWEWCLDWYSQYDVTTILNPAGLYMGTRHVLRGGSWDSITRLIRSANRYAYRPGRRFANFGFRLARSPTRR
ncbi:MAG TPA: formylglycine-generating enzyme family protein [Polyangium sp.]|nr:formylglycine-generating enzyme family protein [Polyangium sp.]